MQFLEESKQAALEQKAHNEEAAIINDWQEAEECVVMKQRAHNEEEAAKMKK